ncbi:MAG: F0F1 ATP synthase subunit delta [Verrucomicrobiota bacterium]
MKLSREARRQARELFAITIVNGRLDTSRLNAVFGEVSEKKPRSYLQILKELTRLVRLEVESRHAVVESAAPLDPAMQREFEAGLNARFGELTTEFRPNPALIGGLRVQIGNDVWDGSVQARLEAVKQQR